MQVDIIKHQDSSHERESLLEIADPRFRPSNPFSWFSYIVSSITSKALVGAIVILRRIASSTLLHSQSQSWDNVKQASRKEGTKERKEGVEYQMREEIGSKHREWEDTSYLILF